jgi:hypothetical protein
MSTDISLFKSGAQLPAHLQGLEMDAATKALAGGVASGRRISIKGGVFRQFVDGKQTAESEDRHMNIVVVAAAPSVNRQFYQGTYQEGVAASPDCWSADGKVSDPKSANRQSVSCSECKQNIAGSGQGDSRACRYQQRLAAVLEGEIDGPVYQLALPATSIFGKGEPNNAKMPLQAYARQLLSNNIPLAAVVTEMRFDTSSATPKLTFRAVRPLTAEEFAISKDRGTSQEATQAVTLNVFQQDSKNKADAKPAVALEAPAEEHIAGEPKVVKPAKPAAPTVKRPTADIIAEWDD